MQFGAWLGTDYVQGTLCGKMPDLMRKDVDKLLEDLPAARKLPERFTRKEQAARREAEATAAAAVPESDGQPGTTGDAAGAAADAAPQVGVQILPLLKSTSLCKGFSRNAKATTLSLTACAPQGAKQWQDSQLMEAYRQNSFVFSTCRLRTL